MQLKGEKYVTFTKSIQSDAYAVKASIRGRKEMKEADLGALRMMTERFRKRARA